MPGSNAMTECVSPPSAIAPPMSLLAELTHRCPLSCPYCSNPLQLERKAQELTGSVWKKILEEAADIGVLQAHFSGGEPMARPDLAELVAHARQLNLYTNLITSGVFINEASLSALDKAGLDHIQLSFQDVLPAEAERMSGFKDVQPRKLEAARLIQRAGIPLTFNFVLHRHNLERIPEMFALALHYGVHRVEMAHTQYYGWAFKNYAALLPSRTQLAKAEEQIDQQRALGGLIIDYVTPDYYADRPKPCMGGWGQRFINISPSGRVLPCHAAENIPGLTFPVFSSELSLRQIWEDSELFQRFRGTSWMPEPCASCDRKEIDWGGCRCQALALTGEAGATDPVCSLSPHRPLIDTLIARAEGEAEAESAQAEEGGKLLYRHFSS